MTDRVPVRRALLSVSDKAGLVDFARTLETLGVELISTGGTARALAEAGLAVIQVAEVTGFPEMMDGRVKTLHPAVHGAILALRDAPEHIAAMEAANIKPIDLVCVNLYPFEETVAREGVTRAQAIEQIDIGGPSMIRSAAKNAPWVAVVTSPDQYERVAAELTAHEGTTSRAMRDKLACAAFERTSAYDAAISAYLSPPDETEPFPMSLNLRLSREQTLRYGENPHQRAAVYRDRAAQGPTIVGATQHGGKELSYNNLLDAAAALSLVQSLAGVDAVRTGACVLKHTNPCGASLADDGPSAIRLAIAGDPVAAYGGILAINRPLDADGARTIAQGGAFFEVVITPSFDDDAVRVLHDRWKNVRLLEVGALDAAEGVPLDYRSVPGGMLVQGRDCEPIRTDSWEHKAGPAPNADDLTTGAFLTACVRALSSNAVVIGGADAGGVRIFGAGAGQMDRVNSCRIAVAKAGDMGKGAIASSEAFFPFADGPQVLIEAGVRMIVQPGGSKRDAETFAVCDKAGVTCVTTGMRHFRH